MNARTDQEHPGADQTDAGGPRNGVMASLRRRPKARRALIALAAAAVAAVLGWWWYQHGRESTDDAQVDGHIVPVAARVSGTVAAVEVVENQRVESGAVLVRLDPRDYRVALQKAEADVAAARAAVAAAHPGVGIAATTTASQLSAARADLQRARASVASAEANLEAARARERQARAEARKAEQDLERMELLIARNEISRQQYDAAVAAAEAARATEAAAKAAVSAAQQAREQAASGVEAAQAAVRSASTGPQQVAVTRAHADAAQASLAQAEAGLAAARDNLAYTTVAAPVTGIVSKKSVEPGQIVQRGQPLLAVVSLDDVWVTANFKETQIRHMHPGQEAEIEVDAYGTTFKGHVESVAAATGSRFSLLPPENATGNYVKVVQRIPVKITIDPGQHAGELLRPGMSVVPTVFTR